MSRGVQAAQTMGRESAVRTLFKSGIFLLLGLGFELAFSFIGKLLVARYLGRVDFGSVAIGITFVSTVSGIGLLGLNTGVARYIPRFESEHRQRSVMVSGYSVGMVMPIAIGAVTYFNAEWVARVILRAPEAGPVLQLFGAGLPFAAFVGLTMGVMRGLKRSTPKVTIDNFVVPVSRLSLVAIGLFLSVSVIGMSLAYVLPYVFAAILSFAFLYRSRLFGDFELTNPVDLDLLTFSLPLLVSAAVSTILTNIDTFFISYYHQTGDVGVYNVVYSLANLVNVGHIALGYLFMPILSEMHSNDQHDDMYRFFQVGAKWILMFMLPVVLVMALFPTMSIAITFGGEYLAGVAVLPILALGFFTVGLSGFNRSPGRW